MTVSVSRKEIKAKLLDSIYEGDILEFSSQLAIAKEVELDLNQPVGKPYPDDRTLLHVAVEHGRSPFVEKLLDLGVDANRTSKVYGCPILKAALIASEDIIQLLLGHDATESLQEAIYILMAKFRELCQPGKREEWRKDRWYEKNGYENALNRHLNCMSEIFSKMPGGQDWNQTCWITTMTSSDECFVVAARMTPLQILCCFELSESTSQIQFTVAELVQALLDRDANPDMVPRHLARPAHKVFSPAVDDPAGEWDLPPLLLATKNGLRTVVNTLWRGGAKLTVTSKSEQNVFHVALESGSTEGVLSGQDGTQGYGMIVMDLVNLYLPKEVISDVKPVTPEDVHGMLNAVDAAGNTPMFYTKTFPDQAVVKLLLSKGAKIRKNRMSVVNVSSRMLRDYLTESCVVSRDASDVSMDFELFLEGGTMINRGELKLAKNERKRYADLGTLEAIKDEPDIIDHPVVEAFLGMAHKSMKWHLVLEAACWILAGIVFFGLYTLDAFQIWQFDLIWLLFALIPMVVFEAFQFFITRHYWHQGNILDLFIILLCITSLLLYHYGEHSWHRSFLAGAFIMFTNRTSYVLFLIWAKPRIIFLYYINSILMNYIYLSWSYIPFFALYALAWYINNLPVYTNLATTTTTSTSSQTTTVDPGTTLEAAGTTTIPPTTTTTSAANTTGSVPRQYALGWLRGMVGLMPDFLGNADYNSDQEFNGMWYMVFLMYYFIIAIVIPNIMNAIAVREVNMDTGKTVMLQLIAKKFLEYKPLPITLGDIPKEVKDSARMEQYKMKEVTHESQTLNILSQMHKLSNEMNRRLGLIETELERQRKERAAQQPPQTQEWQQPKY